MDQINQLAKSSADRKLINLALLERAAAGLTIDGLSGDPDNPILQYLFDQTRYQIRELMGRL